MSLSPYGLKLLQFSVVSTDGGHFSHNYRVDNLLVPDATVYCTKKKRNTNIVLRFQEPYPFTLTHIIVKAPENGFDSPVGEGLIWVSFDPPDIAQSSKFDDYDTSLYESFINSRVRSDSSLALEPHEPAAYFMLRDTWCAVHKLTIPRSGYYVLIKLIRSRTEGENVDIQYLGFKGFVGPHAFQEGSLV